MPRLQGARPVHQGSQQPQRSFVWLRVFGFCKAHRHLLLLSDFEAEKMLEFYQEGHEDRLLHISPAFVKLTFISHCMDNKFPITRDIGMFPGEFRNHVGRFRISAMYSRLVSSPKLSGSVSLRCRPLS
eukprot:g43455.t1